MEAKIRRAADISGAVLNTIRMLCARAQKPANRKHDRSTGLVQSIFEIMGEYGV